MDSAERRQAAALPVLLRFVAIPSAGALLFLLFLHLGFPYERLAARAAARLGQATQSQIEIGSLAAGFSLAGPGLAASNVTAVTRTGSILQLERVFLRPAWSLAWLRANPAVYVDAVGDFGEAQGVATLRAAGFHGRLRRVELAQLPVLAELPGAVLSGLADLDLDLESSEAGPEGSGAFEVRDGMLGVPGLPVPLPFSSLVGELRFGGENLAELSDLVLEGPLVSLRANGTLGHAASVAAAALQLHLELTAQPDARAPLQAAGIALAADGTTQLEITGTPGRPQIR